MTDPVWPGDLLWREALDHHSHAFTDLGDLDGVTATALCGRPVLRSSLPDTTPPEYVRRCMGCLLVHGQQLDDRRGPDWQSL